MNQVNRQLDKVECVDQAYYIFQATMAVCELPKRPTLGERQTTFTGLCWKSAICVVPLC